MGFRCFDGPLDFITFQDTNWAVLIATVFPIPKFSKQFGSQLSGEDGEHLLDVLLEVSKW